MGIQDFLTIISNQGVPIALVFWGTFKIDSFLKSLIKNQIDYGTQLVTINTNIEKLASQIENLIEVIK